MTMESIDGVHQDLREHAGISDETPPESLDNVDKWLDDSLEYEEKSEVKPNCSKLSYVARESVINRLRKVEGENFSLKIMILKYSNLYENLTKLQLNNAVIKPGLFETQNQKAEDSDPPLDSQNDYYTKLTHPTERKLKGSYFGLHLNKNKEIFKPEISLPVKDPNPKETEVKLQHQIDKRDDLTGSGFRERDIGDKAEKMENFKFDAGNILDSGCHIESISTHKMDHKQNIAGSYTSSTKQILSSLPEHLQGKNKGSAFPGPHYEIRKYKISSIGDEPINQNYNKLLSKYGTGPQQMSFAEYQDYNHECRSDDFSRNSSIILENEDDNAITETNAESSVGSFVELNTKDLSIFEKDEYSKTSGILNNKEIREFSSSRKANFREEIKRKIQFMSELITLVRNIEFTKEYRNLLGVN